MKRDIRHHLDPATLMAYSAGSLPEPLAAVAAAHIEMCPHCQDELAALDLIGGALFDAMPVRESESFTGGLPHIPGDVVALTARRDAVAARSARAPRSVIDERLMIGTRLQDVPWRRLGPGVWHHKLSLSEGVTGDLRLLKIAAGKEMPEHGHGGTELTLVLDGAYTDASGRFAVGDIQDVDGDDEHVPVADAEFGCICLVASERPARFKGLFARLVQPLTGM